jgi:hypothetical protein
MAMFHHFLLAKASFSLETKKGEWDLAAIVFRFCGKVS